MWEVGGSSYGQAGEKMNVLALWNFQLAALVMVVGMRAMGEVGSILEKELLGLFYSGIKEQEESNLQVL